MPNSPWHHARNNSVSDDVDFEIKGNELQFVEIELDPGESAVAEAGAMVWKDASIDMTTVFGDGSQPFATAPWSRGERPVRNVACTVQVTAGVTIARARCVPSRAN